MSSNHAYARECAIAARAFVRKVADNEADGDASLTDYLDHGERDLWDRLLDEVDRFSEGEIAYATRHSEV